MENPPKLPEHSEPTGNLKRIDYPANPRLVRMRALSRLLDTAITLPGGFRIGIDPIIGLVPGIGDLIASSLSVWLIYDAARMGISKVTLARMIGNVMMEAAIGAVPLLGDIIDAVWKANARNMRLVEREYLPHLKERTVGKLVAFLAGTLLLVYGSLFLGFYLLFTWLVALVDRFLG